LRRQTPGEAFSIVFRCVGHKKSPQELCGVPGEAVRLPAIGCFSRISLPARQQGLRLFPKLVC
jgi:hypothetical protein